MHVLLAGNPNCGKTTLFNALTGEQQRIGNWPGVTVERKSGQFTHRQQVIALTDLPGVYSLSASIKNASQDEIIAAQAILTEEFDLIINVIDASCLERHLYLTSQLLELKKPVILALNMMDLAQQRGIHIDVDQLSQQLGCPVIQLQSHKKIGLESLKECLSTPLSAAKPLTLALSPELQGEIEKLSQQLHNEQHIADELSDYCALRILEGDAHTFRKEAPSTLIHQEIDILLADARYQCIHNLISACQNKSSDASNHFTAKLDRILLHRFLALPIFFAVMYFMFLFAINIGGAFQDFFDITTDAIFVQGSFWLLHILHSPAWLSVLVANGVGMGINTTLTFIPVLAAMYFFLSLLEASGYMARAAFIVDKLMRMLGLPGKAFVPMIVGFGCNVPAIMAARTLDSERDRLLTVLMSPFMSCSARLAIYAIFVAAFFPQGGQNIVFALYMIGILMAVLTGLLLRKTYFQGEAAPLILELPVYHKPSLKRLLRETSLRLRHFIIRAGKMIIPVCILLGALNNLSWHGGSLSISSVDSASLLSQLGRWLTPFFYPMGIHADNWPATVGLLTGMLAKEVVVGSLNSLYAQLAHLNIASNHFDFYLAFKSAFASIWHNLAQLGAALWNPIAANVAHNDVSDSIYGEMVKHFDGQIGAFAYLIFILLYIPCVSTMAAIRQEANRALMWFSITWSLFIAYTVAVVFYQAATFSLHPSQSVAWILSLSFILGFIVICLRWRTFGIRNKHAFANT